jgi:GDPmannose 4,6-dehydratase
LEKKKALLIGGTGQIGLYLARLLLEKKYKVFISTRKLKARTIKNIKLLKLKKYKIIKLNILDKISTQNIINKIKPDEIYFLSGQSYPSKSFKKKKETSTSIVLACEIILRILYTQKIKCKFFNASSSEIFGNKKKAVTIESKKKPVNPYGEAKLASFNLTKIYREKYKVNTYNGILFNTESVLRPKEFLLPKICISAIKAYKNEKNITQFGNLNITREWNWCEEQVEAIWKFVQGKPRDIILSNCKPYSAKEMLNFAYRFFKLNYENHIKRSNKLFRKNDIYSIKSNPNNKLKNIYKVHGNKIIFRLLKFYLKLLLKGRDLNTIKSS